jgi:ribosomal-protein-alanine N-acetyltransferase
MQNLQSSVAESPSARPAPVRPGNPGGSEWRHALPVLSGAMVRLREVQAEDAPLLVEMMGEAQVARFMSTPPGTVEDFERFIAWARRERHAGSLACFVIVPHGTDEPVGLFQVRLLDDRRGTAEWGFAIGSRFWSSGFYADGAPLIVDFVFGALGVRRLVARAALANGRGNGALQKMGAVREEILRGSLLKDGEYLDQAVWTISAPEWSLGRDSRILRLH